MKNVLIKLAIVLSLTVVVLSSFTIDENNILTEQEKKDGWILLFDGKTTNGWHIYNKGKIPSAWIIQNDELYCKPDTFKVEHGDLVSDKVFQNFELKFEWKISEGGNSGVFFNVIEKESIPTAWASGPEYQLLEESHPDFAISPKKRSGCLYGFYSQKNTAPTKPASQWNQSIIKQVNGQVQFYLNGILTAEQNLNAKEWKALVAKSGFKYFPQFSKSTKGSIALQDWSKGISFRNIKIKNL